MAAMQALLKSLIKKAGYLIAALIIIMAVIVCVIRFTTPILDEHRADFERIASQFLQTPVNIENVRVSWYQYQPVFCLNNVTIRDKETHEPVFQIKKVSIFISIFKSLWNWKIEPSGLMASGAELNISQSATGELLVKEFSTLPFSQQSLNSETKFTDVAAWLSHEQHLILRDIDVHYTGFNEQQRFVTLYDLSFQNSDTEHKIIGKALLHQEIPTEISLAAQWKGRADNLSQMDARAYVYVSRLSLPQWLKGQTWKGWQVKEGMVSAKIWAAWSHGTFQKIQVTFDSLGLKLNSKADKVDHVINRLSGNVGWKREGNSQVFAGDDLLVDLPDHLWPASSFYVSLSPDVNGTWIPTSANIGYVDLNDLQSFMFSAPQLLPEAAKQFLLELKLKGVLQNTAVVFSGPRHDWKHTSLRGSFSQLGFLPRQQYPGAANLSGVFNWNGSQGELKLNSQRVTFKHNLIFANDIYLDQLAGDVQIQNDANHNWLFNLSSLNLLNNDLTMNVNGKVTLPPEGSPVADISANIALQKAAKISRYLPMGTFDKDLTEWLQQAFLAGEVQSGHAIIRGPLVDFPFDHGNGAFSLTCNVKNIDFRFAPDWPLLRHVNGALSFTGRKITIDIDNAETLDMQVKGLHGVIPYVGDAEPQILNVTMDEIQTDFAQGLKYIHSSPLEKTIGKMFADVDLQGLIGLKLNLSIPLSHPDDTKVLGNLSINDSVMNLEPWNLKLDHLNGLITFTEKTTEAKNVKAELFDKPFQFNLTSKQKSKNVSLIEASFTNNVNLKELENWLKLPISQVVHGSADIHGVIDLSLKEPLEIHLRSNLIGTKVDLVDRYGKNAKEARDFSADIILQNDKPMRMKMSYDKLFSTALTLERKQDKYNLIGADLRFGKGAAEWPASPGVYITGQFDKLDWNQIKKYMNQSTGESSIASAAKLKGIDVKVNKLTLGKQSLTQVHVQVTPDETNWNINVNSPEVTGQINVPVNFKRQSWIIAQLQKVNLHTAASSSNQAAVSFDIKNMPGISLIANDVRYNNMPLGQITFKAAPSAAGLNIQILRINSSRMDLRATGDWKQARGGYITHLQGYATSVRVSDFLNSLGMDVRNFVSSNGSLNFNLSWPDAPYSPSITNMYGRASLVMGAGRIVEIGAENGAKMDIGRMLSIFSLQTIPRRLAFDFSDVFSKGYSFDSIRGDFTVQNGNLNTNNMRIDGPVAQVGINGHIGLKNKDYNFVLSVTANVTSSIPVAATLLTGNPLIGLGALAVNTVIGSQVSGVTTNYYSVTGSWNHPVWKSIKSAGNKK